MEATRSHDRTSFITYHLGALLFLGALGFSLIPSCTLSFALPFLIAIAPAPFYYLPGLSQEAAKTCLVSAGAAFLAVVVTYAAGFAGLIWLLGDFRPGA